MFEKERKTTSKLEQNKYFLQLWKNLFQFVVIKLYRSEQIYKRFYTAHLLGIIH